MFPISRCAVIAAAIVAAGCSGAPDNDAGATAGSSGEELVVEHRVEAGVAHVVNVAGSRWQDARLVEELAIGEEAGADPYLFGEITAAWATEDALYVVDAQVPAVRAYDQSGDYRFDIGRPGQGPGEYGWPGGVAVTSDGRMLVADALNARINVYDADGALLEDWPLASQKAAQSLTLTDDDRVFTEVWSLAEARMGVQPVGPAGPLAAPQFPPPIPFENATVGVPDGKGGETMRVLLPYAPTYVWTLAPGGELVAGVGSNYRFEVHRPDGGIMVVERARQPLPVTAGEARFRAEMMSRSVRAMTPEFTLAADALPGHKPAFEAFYADRSGRLWVTREGPGTPDPECSSIDDVGAPQVLVDGAGVTALPTGRKPGEVRTEDLPRECWAPSWEFDLFELDSGELLATIVSPEPGFTAPLFAAGDVVLAAVTDERGTTRLKKYRLVGR